MNPTPNYPALEEANIKIVLKALEADPEYFNDPSCPYSDETKSLFLGNTSTEIDKIVNNIDKQISTLDKLNDQLEKQSQKFDKDKLPSSQVNAFFKQRISILREIIELQKELAHIQNVDAFFAKVLEVMEENLDADQRAAIMDKLRNIVTKED